MIVIGETGNCELNREREGVARPRGVSRHATRRSRTRHVTRLTSVNERARTLYTTVLSLFTARIPHPLRVSTGRVTP